MLLFLLLECILHCCWRLRALGRLWWVCVCAHVDLCHLPFSDVFTIPAMQDYQSSLSVLVKVNLRFTMFAVQWVLLLVQLECELISLAHRYDWVMVILNFCSFNVRFISIHTLISLLFGLISFKWEDTTSKQLQIEILFWSANSRPTSKSYIFYSEDILLYTHSHIHGPCMLNGPVEVLRLMIYSTSKAPILISQGSCTNHHIFNGHLVFVRGK